MDGTLLNSQKQIGEEDQRVLKQAKKEGINVVICTGRPLAAIQGYLDELNLKEPGDYSITFNGGLVQKNDTGEIIEKTLMPVEHIHELFDLASFLDVPMDILSEGTVLQLPTSQNYLSIYGQLNNLLTFKRAQLNHLSADQIYNKAVVAIDADYLDEQIKKIPADFYERYEIIKTRSNLLEFMPKGITKAYGISLLAKDLGIRQEEVMGIGDEENDLPMIQYAGIGIAMDNAVPIVKEAADAVTKNNDQNGVAHAVTEYALKFLKGAD